MPIGPGRLNFNTGDWYLRCTYLAVAENIENCETVSPGCTIRYRAHEYFIALTSEFDQMRGSVIMRHKGKHSKTSAKAANAILTRWVRNR